MIRFDGNRISNSPPILKLNIATGSVYFFVIFVTIPRINPITIWDPENTPVRFPETAVFPARFPLRCMAIFVVNVIRNKNSSIPRNEILKTSLFS